MDAITSPVSSSGESSCSCAEALLVEEVEHGRRCGKAGFDFLGFVTREERAAVIWKEDRKSVV